MSSLQQMTIQQISDEHGWDAVLKYFAELPKDDAKKFAKEFNALARKIQIERQGPITIEMIQRLQDTRKHMTQEQKIEYLQYQLEQAVKNANSRDEKWKSGIEEVCGRKISFGELGDKNPTLQEYIDDLKHERNKLSLELERLRNLLG